MGIGDGSRERDSATSDQGTTATKSSKAGKLTRTQELPQNATAHSAIGRSSLAEANRAEPWLMDDASMSAMGLYAPGEEQESQPPDRGTKRSSTKTWWEPQLRGFLEMPVGDGDDPITKLRLDLLLGTLRAMASEDQRALIGRLENPTAQDELVILFAQKLPQPSIERVRRTLRGDATAFESKPFAAPQSPQVAPTTGHNEMWRHVIGEASTSVGKLARVSAPRGVRLRTAPAPDQPDLGILPFDELVTVERRTAHGWCWVIPAGQLAGTPGFCEEQFLSIDPPEPTAHLHRVAPGDSLREIAASYYGKQFRDGRDARLYVQALYEANKGHQGIYLTEVKLDRSDTIHRGEEEERTLEIYKGAKVREGHALWVPSESFIEKLRASGAISSGTSEFSQIWQGAKAAAGHVVDAATYAAAFTVGLLEGAWNAIVDLFQGAADMIELVAKTVYQLVVGNPGAIKDMLMGWVGKLKGAWADRDKIADTFMQKWESEDAWTRGNFQGEVLGWVMMTALLILATAGQASVAVATGKWASVLRILRTVDALGDVTTYVGAASRIPRKAANEIRRRLGKGAENAAELGSEALEAEAEAARAISNAKERGDSSSNGKTSNRPEMETTTTSLDGHEFHNDIRKLSSAARHVIRQLEARGWVRVAEILPEDLVEISKWFGKEIGVVQTPQGTLRIILGTEDGILSKQIKAGELFLAHTHPVLTSLKGHFDLDLPKAGRHVEAVIDWSGQITYFSKHGIKNPILNGRVEPLLGFRAAFLNNEGAIVGFADVDIIDQAAGTAVKVRK